MLLNIFCIGIITVTFFSKFQFFLKFFSGKHGEIQVYIPGEGSLFRDHWERLFRVCNGRY